MTKKRDVDQARKAWRVFHQKANPDDELTINGGSSLWPDEWVCVGRVVTMYYRSTKWYEDGQAYNYYHHHGPKIYCWVAKSGKNARKAPEAMKAPVKFPLRRPYPSALTVLGDCLGWDLERPDGSRVFARPDAGELACCTPDRRSLVSVHPRSGLTAVIGGLRLRVERRGVVG